MLNKHVKCQQVVELEIVICPSSVKENSKPNTLALPEFGTRLPGKVDNSITESEVPHGLDKALPFAPPLCRALWNTKEHVIGVSRIKEELGPIFLYHPLL